MRHCIRFLLLATFSVPSIHSQMVQRAWVGFHAYFYEAPWTNTHAIVELVCGSPDQQEDIRVSFETVDGTAVAGRDYTETKGTHLFHGGSPARSVLIEVPLLNGALEEDKTFRIRVSSADFPAEVSQTRGNVPITITGLPRLRVAAVDTNLFLTWRASATNLTLLSQPNLQSNPVPVNISSARTNEAWKVLTLPIQAQAEFFFLKTPNPNP